MISPWLLCISEINEIVDDNDAGRFFFSIVVGGRFFYKLLALYCWISQSA